MGKVALVDRYGSTLRVRDGRFQLVVRGGGKVWDLAPVELDSIVFDVTGASISASAIKLASEFGIDLVFMDRGRPIARLIPATYGSTLKTWLRQLKAYRSPKARATLAKRFIEGKVHNQRMVLAEYHKHFKASGRRAPWLSSAIDELDSWLSRLGHVGEDVDEVRAIEASAAKAYWRAIAQLLPSELGFKRRIPRSRLKPGERPDPFNTALNIGYAALRKEVWRAIFMAGLNPYIGFLHKPRAGRMALVLDLMEEFRPALVDRPLIAAARRRPEELARLASEDQEAIRGVWRLIVNHIHREDKPYTSQILAQARLLARHVQGADEYKPFKLRW